MERKDSKTFSCDVETGLCKTNHNHSIEEIDLKPVEKITVLYYTDPICSACWAIEPELKKLKLLYEDYIEIEYKMGGLLPKWEGFSDSGNGISGPKDVAIHWDEVGQYSGMSINGDIWLEDPLSSSYPPSIAFKAMELQGNDIAIRFLRRIREMVFLEKKNITREKHLTDAVKACGGDVDKFLEDYKSAYAQNSFKEDLFQARRMGVRSFPTFIFMRKDGKGFKLAGVSHFDNFIQALEKACEEDLPQAKKLDMDEMDLLKRFPLLSTKEMAVILSKDIPSIIQKLEAAELNGLVKEHEHKFGSFWSIVN